MVGSRVPLWGKGWEGGEAIVKWKPESYHRNTEEWVLGGKSYWMVCYHWFEMSRREKHVLIGKSSEEKKFMFGCRWTDLQYESKYYVSGKNIYNYVWMQNKTKSHKHKAPLFIYFCNTILSYCLWNLWHRRAKENRKMYKIKCSQIVDLH